MLKLAYVAQVHITNDSHSSNSWSSTINNDKFHHIFDLWHKWLGYSNEKISKTILTSFENFSNVLGNQSVMCSSCQMGKCNKLSFNLSMNKSSILLEKMNTDV